MPHYATWMNVVLYQSLWFIAVLGRETWAPLLIVLLGLHLLLCRERVHELAVMVACTLVGASVDALLTIAGVFVFDPAPTLLPVPLWLVAIWLAFAGTLRHALSYFIDRPWLCIAAAGIGGPLSYLAAARLGAVSLPLGHLNTGLLLVAVWIVVMGLLIVIVRQLRHSPLATSPG